MTKQLVAFEKLALRLMVELLLESIDMSISEGEIVTLIGPNAAGKVR